MPTVALLIVVLLACSDALVAQDTATSSPAADTQPPYRSPRAAQIFGTVVPGAGHIYAGEYAKGVGYFYGTVCDIGLGSMAFAVSGLSPGNGPAWPLQVSGALIVGLGVAIWVRGSLDAPRAAARSNAKHRQAATHVSLVLRSSGDAMRSTNLGLSVAW